MQIQTILTSTNTESRSEQSVFCDHFLLNDWLKGQNHLSRVSRMKIGLDRIRHLTKSDESDWNLWQHYTIVHNSAFLMDKIVLFPLFDCCFWSKSQPTDLSYLHQHKWCRNFSSSCLRVTRGQTRHSELHSVLGCWEKQCLSLKSLELSDQCI